MDKTALRDAATVILVRDPGGSPSVLMGQRGETAAFMPSRFVFPGGAMDPGDHHVPFGSDLSPRCLSRMDDRSTPGLGRALAATAIRELWEETGLRLAMPGVWPGEPPEDPGDCQTSQSRACQNSQMSSRTFSSAVRENDERKPSSTYITRTAS